MCPGNFAGSCVVTKLVLRFLFSKFYANDFVIDSALFLDTSKFQGLENFVDFSSSPDALANKKIFLHAKAGDRKFGMARYS